MRVKFFDPEYFERRYGLFAEGEGEGGGSEGGSAGDGGSSGGAEGEGGKAGGEGVQQQQQQQDGDKGKEGQPPDWRAGISNPEARKLADDSTDINHLAERALTMRQKLAKAIIPPGKEAKPEEVAAYRKSLGVPDAPEGYTFDVPEGTELTDADKAIQSTFAKAFHEHNIPAETAKALNGVWNGMVAAQAQAVKEADEAYAKQSDEALRKEWGADYDKNKTYAERAAQQVFGDDFDEVSKIEDKTGRFVLDNPRLMKALAKMGREMGEDRLGPIMSDGDRETAENQLRDIRKQQSEAQGAGDSKRANELYQKEQALIARMNGSKPVVGSQGRAA